MGASAGCLAPDEPPSDPELREALGLGDGVPIHRVNVSGRGAETRLVPSQVPVEPGAVVQFVILDRRAHRIRFLPDSLSPDAHTFLVDTNQVESPLLVEQGSRFVLSFEGAPPGAYPFVVDGHGAPVWGWIHVGSP